MNPPSRFWVITILVGLIFVTAMVVIVLWRSGVIFPRSGHNTLNDYRDPPAATAAAAPDETPLNTRAPISSSSTDEAPAEVVVSTGDLDSELKRWLDPATTAQVHSLPAPPLDYHFNAPLLRTSWGPPSVPNSLLGFSLDTGGECAVVGAPGQNTVWVLQGSTWSAWQGTDQFGLCCLLGSDGRIVIQNETQTFIYAATGECQATLPLSRLYLPLALVGKELWLGHQEQATTTIWMETAEGWAVSEVLPCRTLQVLSLGSTLWTVGSTGLSHWSLDNNNMRVQDGQWWPDTLITSICLLDHPNMLLGQSQLEQVLLVSSLDPNQVVDRITVPGGQPDQSLFGDRVLWWSNEVWVAAPTLHRYPYRECGAILRYELNNNKLVLRGLLGSLRWDVSSNFGSGLGLFQDGVVVSAPGESENQGALYFFRKTT